jgi:ribosome-binding factor A
MKINYQKETKNNFQLQRSSQLEKVLNDVFSKSSFLFEGKSIFVNVVYVDLSQDLMNAKVIIDTFGLSENSKRMLVKKLNKDFIKQIRGIISQKIKMKRTPEIIFYCPEENEKEKIVLDIIERENNNVK